MKKATSFTNESTILQIMDTFNPSPFDRPKTSRKIANPSPEQYFSYVQPSPKMKPEEDDTNVLPIHDSDQSLNLSKKFSENAGLVGSNERRRLITLACFLFGASVDA